MSDGPDHVDVRLKAAVSVIVLIALLVAPAPLLPRHGVAETLQRMLGLGWEAAYLLAAVGLQACFYATLGFLVTIGVDVPANGRKRMIRAAGVWASLALLALLIRSVRLGHVPVFANVVIPVAGVALGVALGFVRRSRGWQASLGVAAITIGMTVIGFLGGPSSF